MSQIGLDKILTISGKQGLYKMIAQTKTGIIATSIIDQKKIATNLGQEINLLSEIRIFGLKDEMPLSEIFKNIYLLEKGKTARVKPKASKDDLEAYFFDVFQDYDQDRVYSTDIKKIIQWYNLLLDFGKYNFELTEEEKPSTTEKK